MMLRKTPMEYEEATARLRASMRPQHDAAENDCGGGLYHDRSRASMRPQHDAAENHVVLCWSAHGHSGFNEAAA